MYKYIFLRNIVVLYPFVALKNQISQSKEEQVTHSRNKSNTQRETSFIYIYIGLDMTCNVIVWFNYSLFLAFLFLSPEHKCIKCIWRKLNRPGEILSTCIFSCTATCAYNFWWGKKLANPFSFASGSQDVKKSSLNQTRWLLN